MISQFFGIQVMVEVTQIILNGPDLMKLIGKKNSHELTSKIS